MPNSPTSSAWLLAPGVHAVSVGDDLVILSIATDAYHCLAGAGSALGPRGEDGPLVLDEAVASWVREAGLLSDGRTMARPLALPPLPQTSAVQPMTSRPSWRDFPMATRCVIDVDRCYRDRSFAQVLEAVTVSRTRLPQGPPSAPLLHLVDRFHRWAPYAPVSGKCFLRSFMLFRLLRRRGHDAQWVFGVATWPFRAHCWLQHGDVALDDSVDGLAAFTPILAV